MLNIISDTPSLPDVEQLAHKMLMLVTTKADQHQLRELIPPTTFQLLLNLLQPSSGCIGDVHGRHFDPHRRIHLTQLEIILTFTEPKFRIITIKNREVNLTQFSEPSIPNSTTTQTKTGSGNRTWSRRRGGGGGESDAHPWLGDEVRL